MKKIFFVFALLLLFSSFINVEASEITGYTNKYGVFFSNEEYDFISDFYFEGYQDYMTQDDYTNFINSDIMNGDIKTEVSDMNDISRSLIYETQMKQLKVSSSCSSDCYIAIILTWKSFPAVRSYDLIGAYFNGTSLIGNVRASMLYDSSSVSPVYSTTSANGVSSTFKLPSNANSLVFKQEFRVSKSGSLNASYQHARKSISLANSKKFSLSKNGYGGVFSFQESVRSYYDAMSGLTLTLS